MTCRTRSGTRVNLVGLTATVRGKRSRGVYEVNYDMPTCSQVQLANLSPLGSRFTLTGRCPCVLVCTAVEYSLSGDE
jgi:hypothetical protein